MTVGFLLSVSNSYPGYSTQINKALHLFEMNYPNNVNLKMSLLERLDGGEHGKVRQRPKSDMFAPKRASTGFVSRGTRPFVLPADGEVLPARPRPLKQRFTAYSLPSPTQRVQLLSLTSKDLMDYFSELNDLRNVSGSRVLPEQYRFIYPPGLLQPAEWSKLLLHITHSCIHVHWQQWLDEIKDLISEWEKAVGMMGKEVETYLSLSENEKAAFKHIDDLNSYTVQEVNKFIELHLDRAIQILKAPRKGNTPPLDSKLLDLGTELDNLKAKYANLHEERRKWTRLKLGYKY